MRLLFDQNLSPSLCHRLGALFPGSLHVRDLSLASGTDDAVWDRAAADGMCIVSKDADFHQLSFLRGAPPKVVWIQRGNCTTSEIADLLITRHEELAAFGADPDAAFLALR